MYSTALMAVVPASLMGWLAAICAVRRWWWEASGAAALGCMFVLILATAGNHSQAEHNVVLATALLLFAYFLITVFATRRAWRGQRGR